MGPVAHQQIGIVLLWQVGQKFSEPDRVDFRRSAAGFGEAEQIGFLHPFKRRHGVRLL
jgi:hypothetical protein